ncbi:unnamed protein product [Sphagnum tenellum]
MGGIIGITRDQLVSTDILDDKRSCVYDSAASMMLNKKFASLVAWYDNEFAYAHRVVDLSKFVSTYMDAEQTER